MRSIWSMILLAAMFALSTQAQASEAPSYASGGEIVNVDSAELGAMERYLPFSMNDNLHPEVESAKTFTWIGSICFGGGCGAWLGSILSLDNKPAQSDALMVGISHWGITFFTSFVGVGLFFMCVDAVWLAPVGVLNAWDRAYKGAGKKRKSAKGLVAPPSMAMAY